MRYFVLLCVLLIVACDEPANTQAQDTDCRQARSACASGFICTDMGGDVFTCVVAQNGVDGALESDVSLANDSGPVNDTGLSTDAGMATDAVMPADGEAALADSGIASVDAAADMGQIGDNEGQISASGYHSCRRFIDGQVACWGRNNHGQIDVPQGQYLAVSTSYWNTCLLNTDGSVRCIGDPQFGHLGVPEQSSAVAVTAAYMHACLLDEAGDVVCWGLDDSGRLNAPDGPFVQVDAGWFHTCGQDSQGGVACWGMNSDGQTDVPDDLGQATAVVAGGAHSCALTEAGDVVCWGSDEFGQLAAPAGEFRHLSAGAEHNCAVMTRVVLSVGDRMLELNAMCPLVSLLFKSVQASTIPALSPSMVRPFAGVRKPWPVDATVERFGKLNTVM